jgi:hypothetical protein
MKTMDLHTKHWTSDIAAIMFIGVIPFTVVMYHMFYIVGLNMMMIVSFTDISEIQQWNIAIGVRLLSIVLLWSVLVMFQLVLVIMFHPDVKQSKTEL